MRSRGEVGVSKATEEAQKGKESAKHFTSSPKIIPV